MTPTPAVPEALVERAAIPVRHEYDTGEGIPHDCIEDAIRIALDAVVPELLAKIERLEAAEHGLSHLGWIEELWNSLAAINAMRDDEDEVESTFAADCLTDVAADRAAFYSALDHWKSLATLDREGRGE